MAVRVTDARCLCRVYWSREPLTFLLILCNSPAACSICTKLLKPFGCWAEAPPNMFLRGLYQEKLVSQGCSYHRNELWCNCKSVIALVSSFFVQYAYMFLISLYLINLSNSAIDSTKCSLPNLWSLNLLHFVMMVHVYSCWDVSYVIKFIIL